ncbi:autotransporter [Haloferula helveola]|uniref:Autotransporter n=1 Tax=Haloferula helveola TaxID=490095 RepID=A0ABN6HD78_9BACT|nr:autotransporter [Haloferula helveola]
MTPRITLLLGFFVTPAFGQAYSWAGPVSGTWGSPVFWSPSTGFPNGAGTTATLSNTAGPYDVILDGSYSVDQFTHNGSGNFTATSRTFTVNGNSTLAGDSMIFSNSNYVSNGTVAHNAGPIDMLDSDFIGSGTFFQSNGTINFESGSITLNGSQTGGTLLFTAGCGLSGGFNNIGGVIDIVGRGDTGLSASLNIGGSTLENSGMIKLRTDFGVSDPANVTLTGTGTLVNYSAGSVTVEAGSGGSRNMDLSIDNQGAIGSNTSLSFARSGASHSNTGSIVLSNGDLSMSLFFDTNNDGLMSSTLGAVALTGNSGGGSILTNTATGSITAGTTLSIGGLQDIDNDGSLQSGGNMSVSGAGSGAVTFDHTGSLTVGPGGGFSMSTTNDGSQLIIQPGSVFSPGDFLDLYRTQLILNQPLSVGASDLDIHQATVGGASTLSIGAGSATTFRGATLSSPILNSANATTISGGTSGLQYSNFYGSFTNQVGGTLTIDSAPNGFAAGRIHVNDFTNEGQFTLTGNTTAYFQVLNQTTSTAKFINEATGTATISGTGTRNFDVPIDNRGTFNILRNTSTDGVVNAVHSNSGTVNIAAAWDVGSLLSFDNSGLLDYTGGALDFLGNNGAGSFFDSSGTINVSQGGAISGFHSHGHSGNININGGTLSVNLGLNGAPQTFTNSGDIEVAPGATLSFYGPWGSDDGLVSLSPASTIDGGGTVLFSQIGITIDGTWDPGTSPVEFHNSTLSGPGNFVGSSGSTLRLRGSNLNTATSNTSAVSVESGGSPNFYTGFYGAFTNLAGGSVTIDSAPAGFAAGRIHVNDFTNFGSFTLTGDTTARFEHLNNASTAKFINETTGTATITGTGTRDFDVPIDNRGQLNIQTATNTNDVTDAVHVNTGTIDIADYWSVSNILSFDNQGDLVSTGGEVHFTGNNNAASLFTNTGSLTTTTTSSIRSFENVVNGGDINVNSGTTSILIGLNLNDQFFTHSGNIEVAPGASIILDGPNGKDDAFATFEPGFTLDGGGDIHHQRLTTTLNDDWNPGASPVNLYQSTLTGTGSLLLQNDSTFRFRNSLVQVPVSNHASATVEAAGGGSAGFNYFYGAFTNESNGVLSLDSSINGFIGTYLNNEDLTNHGQVDFTGNTTNRIQLANSSTSTATFVNESTGTVTIDGAGTRDFDVPIDNRGQFNIQTATTTDGITDASHVNTGTINAGSNWTVSSFLSFDNQADLVSTGGDLYFGGNNSPASIFSNTGTLTTTASSTITGCENVSNGGDINVNADTLRINIGLNLNDQFLTHSGNIEVAPGASIIIDGPNGKDDAFATFEPGFTLDGGGDIHHQRLTTTLNDDWNPGASTVSLYQSTLTGTGSLLLQNGSSFRFRNSLVQVPVSNHASATVEAVGTGSGGYNYFYGAFTNESDGVLSLDSSISGFIGTYLNNEDLTNYGQVDFTGNTTNRIQLANSSTSTATFINESTGTVTIDGNGTRDFDVPIDNRGLFEVLSTTFTDGVIDATHVNSGTIAAAANWTFSSILSFDNSGILSSTGGELNFTGNSSATSFFSNSGQMTTAANSTLSGFENVNLVGGLNITAGSTRVNVGANLNPQTLTVSGNVDVGPGAEFYIYGPGGTDDGAVSFEPGFSVDGTGGFVLNAATLTLNSDWMSGDLDLNLYRGVMNGPGILTTQAAAPSRFRSMNTNISLVNRGDLTVEGSNSSSFANNYFFGATTNQAGASFTLDTTTGGFADLNLHVNDFTNHGTFRIDGTNSGRVEHYASSSTAKFINSATGTVEFAGTGNRTFEPTLENSGSVVVSNSTQFGDTFPLSSSANHGGFRVESGATATIYGDFVNETDGVIGGNGTFNMSTASTFTNNGTIAPGASIGTLSITGSPAPTPTSRFEIELDTTGNDLLQVTGSLSLGGTLKPILLNGFVPSPGDTFVIMACTGTLSGNFDTIEQPLGFGEFVVDVDATNKQVVLSFELTGPLSYADFQSIYFTPAQIANGDADRGNDFDGDGLTNEMEWIHGLDPTDPTIPTAPFRIQKSGGTVELIFLESNLLPPSVQLDVTTTIDLASPPAIIPAPDAPRISETPLPGYPDIDEVTLELTDPAWTGSNVRFFQLEFTDTSP